ncbi:hypothetical protein PM10SUCC1_05580 [Propionigenium maris DSM 9537]|uniref:Uncharacterized protein n=1 Tax=Propionigenium maris DSM 9537 TaxID=1123000 RepID=A0A9W6GGX4_9FUSO|nr:hypothetical protein PM10SUCC1_05580 [Propionigenium maris DSM 9537]
MLIENKYAFFSTLVQNNDERSEFFPDISYINYLKMIKRREKIIYFSEKNYNKF